ncbi:MAG: ribokinase [Actinomycetota bacterium]
MTAPVIVVGSANMDLVVAVRDLPGPGETVSGGTYTRTLGGKGANQAAAAATLGARTWLVGMTGDDEHGQLIRADLTARGVDLSGVGHGLGPTGVAQIVVDRRGENQIAVAPGANDELTPDAARRHVERLAEAGSVVLAVLEVPAESVLAGAEAARTHGCRFLLNPAPAASLPVELLELCDVVTPNEREIEILGSPRELIRSGVGAVVVTRGAGGADLFLQDGSVHHQDAYPIEVVDTTGAGDAFNGALAWGLADGRSIEEALALAAAAGALATRALGARASLPDREEVERLVAR